MLALETSRFLDEQMKASMAECPADWTEAGQIIFIRKKMEAAYARARQMEEGPAETP